MSQTANPLKNYFRKPVMYIRLPSGGRYWPEGSLNMPPNGELGVLPMTALDEISYRTPDALFNGDAIVSVIQSCVPNILNAWYIPSVDLNTVLTAIRIASFGNELDLESSCPNCTHQYDFTIDLRSVMDGIESPRFDQALKFGDIEILFRPMSFEHQNRINLLQFDQQRTLQQLPSSDLSEEEKNKKIDDTVKEITRITFQAIQTSISGIRTPESVVAQPEFIQEYLANCDSKTFNAIKDHVIQLRSVENFKPLAMTCPECKHQYQQPFVIDTALFFANAS